MSLYLECTAVEINVETIEYRTATNNIEDFCQKSSLFKLSIRNSYHRQE